MADKFLNLVDLAAIRTWILGKLGGKQDTLVSGTNIKTINNTSLLGSGNIDISGGGSEIYIARQNESTYAEIKQAIDDGKVIYVLDNNLSSKPVIVSRAYYTIAYIELSGATSTARVTGGNVTQDSTVVFGFTVIIKSDNTWQYDSKMYYIDQTYDYESANAQSGVAVAEAISGIANPNESVTFNANGQLQVGGRLGQYPDGGVYYPTNIEPSGVGASSFLMTDGAKGVAITQRTFAIMAGANITCKSAAAGATEYRVSNTQTNRFALAAAVGGRAALSQADAAANGTAAITSIKYANGNTLTTPYFGANESNNDIIVTLERSINPSAATTTIRVYGKNVTSDNILVGQGVGAGGGKVISLGQSTYAGGNQNVSIGNSTYVNANNSVAMGHTMLVNKQYCLGAGQGHDFTNGANGTTAVGTWSEISSTTKFAVGNGTAYDARSNIFEVRTDGSATAMILKSPNGSKFKVTVSDSGELSVTAI